MSFPGSATPLSTMSPFIHIFGAMCGKLDFGKYSIFLRNVYFCYNTDMYFKFNFAFVFKISSG